MLKDKTLSIITSNTLMAIGLRGILTDLFNPGAVRIYPDFNTFSCAEENQQHDLVFTNPDMYVSHIENFQSIRNRLVILVSDSQNNFSTNNSFAVLNISLSEEEIASEMEKIFTSKIKQSHSEGTEELTVREIEVLKLVALGLINKQIADQLSISLHTVISHRKNITRKLGIKTVSGLTVYALLNGIINSEELE